MKDPWPSAKARRVLRALQKLGWNEIRRSGSHRTLARPGWKNFTFAYHDNAEIHPNAMKLLGEKTGLRPSDL